MVNLYSMMRLHIWEVRVRDDPDAHSCKELTNQVYVSCFRERESDKKKVGLTIV